MINIAQWFHEEKFSLPMSTMKPLCNIYHVIDIQWNPYIADTIGELDVGRYRGPAVAEGFYK